MDPREIDRLYLDHVASLEKSYAGVLAREGYDGVAIHSGSLIARSDFDDQFWPLRPTPHWNHWLPLSEPDGLLIVRPGRRAKLVRLTGRSIWEAPPAPESHAFLEAFDSALAPDLASTRTELERERFALVADPRSGAASRFGDFVSLNPPSLVTALDALRAHKTPYEVACLVEANRRAAAGHQALRTAFRERSDSELSELELHLLYLRATAQDDGDTPYKNIVAMGRNAATLHHVAYARSPGAKDSGSLLVDAGATCRGYGSDITRTWVKGAGAVTDAFSHLVAEVDAMQQRMCRSIQIGCPYEALHDASHREVARILKQVGLWRGSEDEALGGGVTRAFYPHGLGHSLGIQTHDVGCALRPPRADNPFLRNTSDVSVGQVFTIEPGVYFIDSLLQAIHATPAGASVAWDLVDALSRFGGVRIEDDVHVDGSASVVRNLTREHLPEGGGAVARA